MSAYDLDGLPLNRQTNQIRWARIDKTKPGGLHQPKRDGDVGWDLEAMEDVTLAPMESADIAVNARLHLPAGVYADVRNRSSMARRGLYVDQNVIDNGYRGPMFVFVRNMHLPISVTEPYDFGRHESSMPAVTVKAGERVAQLVFHSYELFWDNEIEEIDTDTQRGERGLGSTGT